MTSSECVAVSSRIRLARNFADYPFPDRLLKSPHAEEQASEIVRIVAAELNTLEEFEFYDVGSLADEGAAYLVERNLISRDLVRHSRISAALISLDGSISVMINEEDHIREQYFMKGYDLRKAYERITGIDDVISESIPFAFDEDLGYLTACPTNLGTGMRASVMLFLPALSRRGLMKTVIPELNRVGLTVRGTSGEGSGAEGDLFQISNEVTLGMSEGDILTAVEKAVNFVVGCEMKERDRMRIEEGIALRDRIMRSYGILANCCKLDMKEFIERAADVKLGLALGFFGAKDPEKAFSDMDDLIVAMRPANLSRMNKGFETDLDVCRAESVKKKVGSIPIAR